jgi:outer membrane protein assembly factor BamB
MLWQRIVAPAFKNAMGNGPRATPAIAGGQVFTFSGEGILSAVSLADGTVAWSENCLKTLGGKQADYGMACSPLVEGGKVIVTVGAPAATVVAYDVKTGKQAWVAGKGDPAGYSSPAMLNVGGTRQLVVFNGRAAMGIDPADGSLLWRYDYVTDYDCNIATPLAFKGSVFLSAGENHGATMLSLHKTGVTFQANPGWESFGPGSVMRNEWQTSILLDGYLYGFDNVGGAGPISHLTCVEAGTGKRVWQQIRFGKGNMIAADGKLFLTTIKGDLVIVKASPEGFQELGRQQVLETTRQAPSLAGGLLYVRDNNEIVCFDVRKP